MLSAMVCGCAKEEGTALDRDAFYRPPPGTDTQRHVLEDRPGPLEYDSVRMDLLDPAPTVNVLAPEKKRAEPSVTSISEEVSESISLPGSPGFAETAPATAPATAPSAVLPPPRTGAPSGVALLIGRVVCEVNGQPIYADKVLATLSKAFAAEAKNRDEKSFRVYAKQEIERQVNLLIGSELEYAKAKNELDAREKQLADALTARRRQELITQAGGSVEQARARAEADGWDFDELVADEYRTFVLRIYYEKRVFPHVQMRAEDLRRYYNQNLQTKFTEQDQAQFRVIKIDFRKTGGETQARDKIELLRQRAVAGEDFAAMAASVNDDPTLMRAGGDVGWVQRGAYRLEPLEEAVWKIQPGEVTEVVRINDAFYIAKLENRKQGRVQPFEEQGVQREIEKTLRAQMLDAMRSRQREALIKDAIIYPYPPDVTPVVEMAMQRYFVWTAGGS
jgi:parvulin-like peptidyl-prolyl isomerase